VPQILCASYRWYDWQHCNISLVNFVSLYYFSLFCYYYKRDVKSTILRALFTAFFLLGLLFDPEDGGSMDSYGRLYHGRYYGSQMAVSLSTLGADRPLHPGRFLVLISFRGWVGPRVIMRLEGLHPLKNPIISWGIETATFRLVA
jgi:hypothetical protein